MSNHLSFDARQMTAGTADLKASGNTFVDAFTKLASAAAQVTAIEQQKPAGNDQAGKDFEGWYGKYKESIIKEGRDVGKLIADLGLDVEKALAIFTATDLDGADSMKLE